jgi:hypothetical protein
VILAVASIWPHLLLAHWLSWPWWPASGKASAFFSGFGADLGELTIFTILFRKLNCHAPRCPRIGHHPTADGLHHLCRRHHPDIPRRRMPLAAIHAAHHRAKEQGRP